MRHLTPLIAQNPPTPLLGLLSDSWFVAPADQSRAGVMQADGRVGVLLSATPHIPGRRAQLVPESFRVGAIRLEVAPGCALMGVRFEPGAFRSLFGVSFPAFAAGASTPNLLRLQEIMQGTFHELLGETASLEQARSAVIDCLMELEPRPVPHWAKLERAVQTLSDSPLAVNTTELARAAGLSRRHFERHFLDCVGMSPRVFLRVQRVNRARRLLRAGISVAQTAQHCGFADQPHLTREFRALLGTTPSRYQRRAPILVR